ncbi:MULTISPECIES: Lsr2 family protein [unclassified Rathayibacter]|uniref:histone-like nucleoid-structuring protein Lsr2 n=1 Tax=unclassified Rathayibacter TaxID=2609250 RepID=UPI000CE7DB77|nr:MULTISPECIES: Lsr2 family protein [unclassified Rathayibacter]PPH13306.1 Lsr2 family protein [Rathayibacter sp. AY1C1]QHC73769.1 Lsr2 family protein [Rathayibacter sp. VKM Ac-2805]
MAQKLTLVDDLDGNPIEDGKGGTVRFALEGVSYEIDLNDSNIEQLHAALATFIDAGRKTGGRAGASSAPSNSSAKKSNPKELQAIREWAKSNGHKVSDRGRIPTSIVEAYEAAH